MTGARPLMVAAIGGNALLRRGQQPTIAVQRDNLRRAGAELAAMAERCRLVVTHGNGPQVGLLARQAEAVADGGGEPAVPFDVLTAESEGLIGYLLGEELSRHLGADRVVVVLTRVTVDPADPAFAAPTKPVGTTLTEAAARRAAADRGWSVAADGDGWRRVVASPEPLAVVEAGAIGVLLDAGLVVVCAGGGGIPVVVGREAEGPVDAVVDKDLTSSLLAVQLGADELVILTDVDGVFRDWGTPRSALLGEATVAELRRTRWSIGSMAPKVEAACRFVEATGRPARIGSTVVHR